MSLAECLLGQEKQNRSCKKKAFHLINDERLFCSYASLYVHKDRVAREGRVAYVLKVAVFDEEHEKDLQSEINLFLKGMDDDQIIDIKYNVAVICEQGGEQLYCFSALILYKK